MTIDTAAASASDAFGPGESPLAGPDLGFPAATSAAEAHPGERITYRASGGRRLAFSFIFLLLLPFYISLAPMLAAAMTPTDSLALPALAALGAVLGHNYTCWLGFKGGKGVATSAGAMAALIPPAFGVTVITWLLVFFLSRYVSMASIAAALILPVATIFTVSGPTRWPLVAFTSALAALAVWRHRANIERLKAGTEHRINKSKFSAS